jgi:DGQHR domain-containing protein
MSKPSNKTVPALKVEQWLPSWDKVKFDPKRHRAKPERHFYIFSMAASELRSLCGIFRRQTKGVSPRSADLGIQRQHDPERSEEITHFIESGYPWSTLSEAKRNSEKFQDLKKPGWLPTSVVINILRKGDHREGEKIADGDVVEIGNKSSLPALTLPYADWTPRWEPKTLPPFEVIDGQHRLWAFDTEGKAAADFQLPVVAFHGLDISWQAYLFYTINIKPKRINPSLAFDLYPLLRAEDWLERAEEHVVYRETRSQELTEALWSYPESPWYDRINMLGERGTRAVTQNAWIRALTATFVKSWESRAGRTGGLFGERFGDKDEVLRWSRAQQAAFLIYSWSTLREAINDSNSDWVSALRVAAKLPKGKRPKPEEEPGFYSPVSLISTDQGIRGYLMVLNDICYSLAPKLKLNDWNLKPASGPLQEAAIRDALKSLSGLPVAKLIRALATALASFDWRTSNAEGLDRTDRQLKAAFRGSGGYSELRGSLLRHIAEHATGELKIAADRLSKEN